MKRYNIYYTKYNIMARDYIPYIKVVYTNDIYHEIGKMICTSIERIDRISYTEPRASEEACEKYWLEEGYERLSNNLWFLSEKPEPEPENQYEKKVVYTQLAK